jgi:hypothetical protein
MPTFDDRGCCVVSATDPYYHVLDFLDRSHYFCFQVAPQLYSRGWVDPRYRLITSQKIWQRRESNPGLWISGKTIINMDVFLWIPRTSPTLTKYEGSLLRTQTQPLVSNTRYLNVIHFFEPFFNIILPSKFSSREYSPFQFQPIVIDLMYFIRHPCVLQALVITSSMIWSP